MRAFVMGAVIACEVSCARQQPVPLPEKEVGAGPGWIPFEVCDGLELRAVPSALPGYPAFRCAKVCERSDLCRHPEPEKAEGRMHLAQVRFTVDGVAGRLRLPLRFDATDRVKAGLFIQAGGSATEWGDANHSLWGPLERDGLMVVGVRYDEMPNPNGYGEGWLATTTDAQPDYVKTTRRVAAVMRFVHQYAVPEGVPFGVVGTSNGGLATVGAVAWHGLDPIVDWQVVNSGAVNADLAMKCRMEAGEPLTGVCENDPERDCDRDAQCGGGKDRCAFPLMGDDREDRLDKIFQADRICRTGRERLTAASLAGPLPVDLSWDHPVEFVVTEGTRDDRAKWDDTNMGITWQMAWLWRHLEVTHPDGKHWYNLDGYSHAVALNQPEIEPLVACAARQALGLPGTAHCDVRAARKTVILSR